MSNFIKSNEISTISIIVGGVIGLAIAYYFHNNKSAKKAWKIPENWKTAGKVTQIHLYPLKSGKKIDLQSADCTQVGLQQSSTDGNTNGRNLRLRDRSFIVYKEENREFRTASTHPHMILVDISVHDDSHVAFDAPGMRTLYVAIPEVREENTLKIIKQQSEEVFSIDCGDEAAKWFSRYMNNAEEGLRLAFNNNTHPRDITKSHRKFIEVYADLNNKSVGLYSDLTSVMLCNQLSVDDLNGRMAGNKVTVDYFRPNVVVSVGKAYEEDNWGWVKIGECVFKIVMPCTRCILTTVNPVNGVKNSDGEPLTTLKKYRLLEDPKERAFYPTPKMGIYLETVKIGQIKVGDAILVA